MLRRMMDNSGDENKNDPFKGTKNILFAIIAISAIMFLAPELMTGGSCDAGEPVEGTNSCLIDVSADICTNAYDGTHSSTDGCLYTPGGNADETVVKIANQVESGAKAILNVMKWVVLAAGVAVVVAMRVKPRHIAVPAA